MLHDLSLDQALDYRPTLTVPDDLGEFWDDTLARVGDQAASYERVDSGRVTVETYDVTLGGFDGQPVRAWLHLPATALRSGPLPGVVQFQGYNGGRGLPHEHVFWASAGYAHLVVDTGGRAAAGRPVPRATRSAPDRPSPASSPGGSRVRVPTTTGGCTPMPWPRSR